jgi:hypothetical protein
MKKLIMKPDGRSINCYRQREKETFWTARVYLVQEYIGYIDTNNKTYYAWDGRRHDYTLEELEQIIDTIKGI